jgi:RNA polymerase sigma-70 factor (ECF subfamily)
MNKADIVKLAVNARKGDEAAFEELCRAKQREILFTAKTMLTNDADAEDATQETIIMMYRSLGQLKNPEAINAWIQTIVRSRCIEILRKRSKYYTEADIDDEQIVITEENREFLPEAYAEDEALSDRLYNIVQELPEKRRETILLYYYEDLSYKEIAEITGTSVKTVSTNLMKAKKMIKDRLDDDKKYDGNNLKNMALGTASSSTVMGRMFKNQALKQVTDEQLASLEIKWSAQLKAIGQPAATAGHAAGHAIMIKAAVCVLVTVASFSGIVYSVSHFGGADASGGADTPVAAAHSSREIIFAGDDCDCGHINPHSISLTGREQGDSAPVWEIRTDGDVRLASGDSAEISQIVQNMTDNARKGQYKVICILSDKSGNAVKMTREFLIGAYKGDGVDYGTAK